MTVMDNGLWYLILGVMGVSGLCFLILLTIDYLANLAADRWV
jgi:hypothetical protein